MNCSTPGFPVHHHLLELAQTHVHRDSDAIQPSHPLSSPSPASIFPSIKIFSKELFPRIRRPKYWSFSFSISLSNEYSGLISFRMDWLDLLAVQVTLQSFIQYHSSKVSGKTIVLTRWTFVGKVMSLLFNMLSRLVSLQGVNDF